MLLHNEIKPLALRRLIRQQKITFGGNAKLKIYGRLNCSSGKRMLKQNRVFFVNENEALEYNFRPCGNCMKAAYQTYKNGLV